MKAPVEEVKIRRLMAADLDRVMEIERSLSQAPHWPRGSYETVLAPASSRRLALVAEVPVTGGIVGYAVASLLPPQAELESIAVAAEEQGRGIGRKLFSAIVEALKAAGVSELLLEVRPSNQSALEFYRRLGWNEAGRRARYYTDPEEDAILMRLGLEQS